MDENNLFDNGYNNQGILTSLDMPLFGVSNIGHMDSVVQGEKHVTHSKEGEEFIQNLFHMILPLFSGKDRSNLCIFWLQYEIAKVMYFLLSNTDSRPNVHIISTNLFLKLTILDRKEYPI